MQRWTTQTIRDELRHGHSGLIWLLDEVDAHLRGLIEDPECPEMILEELIGYAKRFCDEVAGHIDEEEDDLFPLVQSVLAGPDLDELDSLSREHGELLCDLARLSTALGKLVEEPDSRVPETFADMLELSNQTRAHLAAHSKHERAFLRSIEDRLAHACINGC